MEEYYYLATKANPIGQGGEVMAAVLEVLVDTSRVEHGYLG